MQKTLYIFGVLSLILVVGVGIGFGLFVYKGRMLDAESKEFVDVAIPAIVENWDKEELLERATPELRESVKSTELRDLFNNFSQLGHLVKYEGSTGQSTTSYIIGSGSTVSASYIARAKFQNGSAIFRIVLMKRDEHWMIHNFHVDSVPANQNGQGL